VLARAGPAAAVITVCNDREQVGFRVSELISAGPAEIAHSGCRAVRHVGAIMALVLMQVATECHEVGTIFSGGCDPCRRQYEVG
jgi:hypothetical protein